MPRLKTRYDNVKVWRPHGTPYAEGEPTDWVFIDPMDVHAVELAVNRAVIAFRREFGRFPRRGALVVEVVGTTAGCRAVVYELPYNEEESANVQGSPGVDGKG
jgi:hypothetical protein